MSNSYGWSIQDEESVDETLELVRSRMTDPQCHILTKLRSGKCSTSDLAAFLETQKCKKTRRNYGGKPSRTMTELSKARTRLSDFLWTPDGFSQRFKIEIPEGKAGQLHGLSVTPNIPPQNATAFWAAYLGNGLPTRLVTGANTASHTTTVNVRGYGDVIMETWEEDKPRNEIEVDRRTDAFIAISNVRSMFHLYEYFNAWHRRSERQLEPELLAEAEQFYGKEANYIFFGTPFDCESIMDLELHIWKDTHSCLFFNADRTKYRTINRNGEYRVWVIRNWNHPNFHTFVQAAHSSVLEVVCRALTSDHGVSEMIRALTKRQQQPGGNGRWRGFPPEFRLELRVKLTDDGTSTEYIRVGEYTEMERWSPGPPTFDPDRLYCNYLDVWWQRPW